MANEGSKITTFSHYNDNGDSDNDWSLGNSIIILEEEVEDMVEVKKRKRWSKK